MDPQTPTEPPPPAYELEHEYDRKISEAVERSLTLSSRAQQPTSLPPDEEDDWEEWDEARFEAAAAHARAREQGQKTEQSKPPISRHLSEKQRLAMQDASQRDHSSGEASSSTSSAPAGQPRRLPPPPSAKERPSWYSEAQLDASTPSGSSQDNQVSPPPLIHHLPPEEEDPDEPLPPFVAVGPSLEGPPFDEVVREPPRLPPASNIDSPPQSPLDSVESDSVPDPQSLPQSSSRVGYVARTGLSNRGFSEGYLSTPLRPPLAPPMRRTSPTPRHDPLPRPPPPMRFDPSVAYTKHINVNVPSSEPEPIDASAFYNSAVSAHIGPSQTFKKTTPLRGDTISSLYSNRSEATVASTTQRNALVSNSYYPGRSQFVPNSQPPPQQPQLGVPSSFGTSPRAPTPTPRWPPSNNNGGGYPR